MLRRLLLTAAILATWIPSAGAIDFAPTIAAAREAESPEEGAERRPMVVMFSGPSCSWCRKMEVDTFPSEPVSVLADQFLWAKVDVEEHEELAAEFNVRGLPHLVVLNADDRVIAAQPGYQTPERFVEFLTKALENPVPIDNIVPDLLNKLNDEAAPEVRAEAVTGIIEQLAKADREGRTAALDGLVKAGPIAWQRLAELLQDDRLAIRAAAATVLAKSTKADLPFDPFAPLEARTQQAQAWAAWVAEHAVKAEIETTPAI